MNFLLDTNVISEWAKPKPSPRVVAWLTDVDEDCVFLSVITIAEIQQGIEALPPQTAKRERLETWLQEDLVVRFEGRLLGVDLETALNWGRTAVSAKAAGRQIGVMDGLIAATALRHDLILVTRNVADFGRTGIRLLNPWQE